MSISISSQYTQRNYTWVDWKQVLAAKDFAYQYDDDGNIYTVYGYDGPEVIICQIWKNAVPPTVINNSIITQEQNDLDKADFETNYKANGNKVIDQVNQQRKSIYQASYCNFYSPATLPNSYYKAIDLSNTDGYYQHPTGKTTLKMYGIDCIAARTDSRDVWIIELGIVTGVSATTADLTFIHPGSLYLSDNGINSSNSTNLDYPIFIDYTVSGGKLVNVVGGVIVPGVPGLGITIPITNAVGASGFTNVGDVIIVVSCVSNVTGFVPVTPLGSLVFQYHFWYIID
jgi:hypothetical protein